MAILYCYPLHKPWGSFGDAVRAVLTHQVYRHPELGVGYGLSKSKSELMLRMVGRDNGRNKGTSKRIALKKGKLRESSRQLR